MFLTFLVGILDMVTGIELSVSLFYLIPIAITSWFLGKRAGLFISLLSGIIWFVSDAILNDTYSHPLIPYWNALVLLGFFVIVTIILSALKAAIEMENNLAIKVQQGLLPKQAPSFAGYKTSLVWKPKSFVSGDYYDFINVNTHGLGICLGDVAGHGVSAALLMSNLQAAVRLLSHQDNSSDKICLKINEFLLENELPGKFITFFYGIVNRENNSFEYTNAGHNPPILISPDGKIRKLESGGPVLGVTQTQEYKSETIPLSEGDKIILYTDGLIEVKNSAGEYYDEERLLKACQMNRSLDCEEMSDKIMQSVSEFCGGVFEDDVTLLILSHNLINR